MHKIYKITSILLLLFNLIGAYYGGINLIIHPDGSSIGLSLDLIGKTPFDDFLLPGLILLFINGIFCSYVLLQVIRNHKFQNEYIIIQGLLLIIWIIIQIILIRMVFFLHYIMGGIGIVLIILGWKQKNK